MFTSLLYERIMAYLIWAQFLFVLLQTEGGIDNDTKDLLKVFESIVERGDTVLFIEHNSAMIEFADHFVTLGPGSGENGGELV